MAVGQPTVVEDLQQGIEHVRMGLFDLVEKHHAIGLAPHGLGELAALVVADVARRRTDQTGHGMAFHVLGHVEAHHVLLGIEERGGQRLAELGLADAGRAEEDERTDRPIRVLEPGPGPQHGIGHGGDRLVLADHPFVQLIAQAQKFLALALQEPRDRNARPAGNDHGHIVRTDLLADHPNAAGLLGDGRFLGGQVLFQAGQSAVTQFGGPVEVVVAFGFLDGELGRFDILLDMAQDLDGLLLLFPLGQVAALLLLEVGQLLFELFQPVEGSLIGLAAQGLALDFELHDLAVGLIQFRRQRIDLGADHGRRLIDQVDGLVRKLPVSDITGREHRRFDDGGVADAHAMVHLEALTQPPKDGNGVLDRGLIHQHGLEAAFQRRVLFDVLAVLVEGGRADAVELAPGQHGLEHIAGIHGTFGLARADDGVQFVDKKDDSPLGGLDLLQHGLEALLELAPVLGPGNERPDIQGEDGLVL